MIKRNNALTVDGCNEATQRQQNPNLHNAYVDGLVRQWSPNAVIER